jgi:outer membrane immunogenic protein
MSNRILSARHFWRELEMQRTTLRLIATVGAVLAVLSSPAFAGGSIKDAPMAAPAYNWTGPYIGAHIGWARAASDITTDPALVNTTQIFNQRISNDSFAGGVELGYNLQSGALVWGIAGDITAMRPDALGIMDSVSLDEVYRAKMDWLATVRVRLGIAMGQTLPYITGGIAFGHVNVGYQNFTNATRTVLENEAFASSTKTGWVLGAGIEHAISSRWTIKLEYLHADLGKVRVLDVYGPNGTNDGLFDVRTDTVKFGINYKF